MKLLFIGDSHATAVVRAIKWDSHGDVTGRDIRQDPATGTRSKDITPAKLAGIDGDRLYFCLGGTEYNLVGLIQTDPPFDFLFADSDEVAAGSRFLPRSVVKATMKSMMRSVIQRSRALVELVGAPAAYVAPPPPFRSLKAEATLPTSFQDMMAMGIAPAPLRHKLYRLQNEIMRETCDAMGAAYLDAPAEGQDADGFLREDYWDNDPTHGNRDYGKLVLNQIRRHAHG